MSEGFAIGEGMGGRRPILGGLVDHNPTGTEPIFGMVYSELMIQLYYSSKAGRDG